MSIFDETPAVPINFFCKYCGNLMVQRGGILIVCECPGYLKEKQKFEERKSLWLQEQKALTAAPHNRKRGSKKYG